MDPADFSADLLQKPQALADLAAAFKPGGEVAEALAAVPRGAQVRRIVFLGMGSSRSAAGVAAGRLRAAGFDAVSEYASAVRGTPPGPETLVVAISATGGSVETQRAVERHRGRSPLVLLTNRPGSPLAAGALSVPMVAGVEQGGVACRTYQHTGLILRALEEHLLQADVAAGAPPFEAVRALTARVAEASADLLDRRHEWFTPVERLSSAEQAALMFREGPRLVADAGETGDWAHIDVYLTKTCDYRALLFPGSTWDDQAWQWLIERDATVVSVGADLPPAARGARTLGLRYLHDHDDDVRLSTEVLVAELLAAHWWARTGA